MARKQQGLVSRDSQPGLEGRVVLVGDVRLADLDGRDFVLRLEDGTRVAGKFSSEQEDLVTDALREHSTRHLRVKGQIKPNSSKGKIRRLRSVEELTIISAEEVSAPVDNRPIWEIIMELGASIPDEEWAKVPTDGAKNLDHYLYGAPKEEE
jgi:hypothetical protein